MGIECSGLASMVDIFVFHMVTLTVLQRGSLLSEPAIQVRRKGKGKQIWSLEKLDNRLLDMRDLYQEWKECEEDTPVSYLRKRTKLVVIEETKQEGAYPFLGKNCSFC